ncbi:MAG: phage holin family protein [Acidovorax sp.]
MNWLSLIGLEGFVARWRALVLEGAIGFDDRVTLARLEWRDQRRHMLHALLLTLAVGGLGVVALLLLSVALLVQFWDTPQRLFVAWTIAAVWLVVWAVALATLLSALRRVAHGFALTRRELALDWRDIKERL